MLDANARRGCGRPIHEVSLWTFQRNVGARRFYERNRFVVMESTDGANNEEGDPDVRYTRAIRSSGGSERCLLKIWSTRPRRTLISSGSVIIGQRRCCQYRVGVPFTATSSRRAQRRKRWFSARKA